MNNLDKNGFAIEDCRVMVHNYNRENNEYSGSTQEYVVQGSGIPALSTLIAPLAEKAGFTQVFNEVEQAWEYVEDHRGEDVYSTIDGSKVEIKELGTLPENATNQPKTDGYYKWNGETWVEDIEAKNEATKQQNIAFLSTETRRVNDAITPLDDAIEFEIATEEEIVRHKELRKYRILLSRVPNQKAWPLEVTWPECPEFFKLN